MGKIKNGKILYLDTSSKKGFQSNSDYTLQINILITPYSS